MNLGWLRFSLWMLAWMALALVPMAIALLGPLPDARGQLLETGVMLGLLGLGVLSAQALTSGRQRWFARGLGQDDQGTPLGEGAAERDDRPELLRDPGVARVRPARLAKTV